MDKDKIQRSIVITKEQADNLSKIAKRKYMSINDVIRQAIDLYIKEKLVNNDN